MDNQIITGRQMKYVIALFLIGSSLVAGTTAEAGQDSWICMLIATVMVLPMLFVFNAILRLYPGENLFQIIINIFGNIFGKVICSIYVIYAIHLGSLILNIFAEFIHIANMPETPKIIIVWFMIIPCIYLVYSGLAVAGRTAKFLYPFVFISVAFTILLSFKDMDFNNIKPILTTEMKSLFNSSFTVFALPLGETVLFMSLFSLNPKENYGKVLFNGVILAMIVLIAANLRNLFILGANGIKMFPFSSYQAVSIIAVGEFLTRLEVIIAINLLIAGFFKISVCCFSSAIGLAKIFNVSEYKYFVTPASLIMVTLVSISFKNTIEMLDFVEIYKYYVIPYQLIIPVIILITGLIKTKAQKKLIAQ